MNLRGKQDGSPNVEALWGRILACVERNLAIAAIVVWFIFTWIVSRRSDFARTGQFGDSFGTLNALFASLAAVAAFKAYWSQRQQLKEQQEEFRVQRHESHLFFLMEELREAVRGVTVKDLAIRKGPPDELVGPVAVCQLENLLLGMIGTESAEVFLLRESVEYLRRLSFIVEARFALFDGNAGRETPKPEQGGQ